jgi:hypothetical protein
LVRNISREVLTQMVGLSTTTAVWKAVMEIFFVQSQSQIVHLHTKMNQCRKEDKIGQVYLDEIKGLSGEMASAGKPMDTMDVISHILAGLDDTYDVFRFRDQCLVGGGEERDSERCICSVHGI